MSSQTVPRPDADNTCPFTAPQVQAGTACKSLATLAGYPLDTLKTRLQVSLPMTPAAAGLLQRAGSLYLGVAGSVLVALPGTLAYFAVDTTCRKQLSGSSLSPIAPLISSALAGLASSVLKVPADVMKHRVQAYRAANVVEAAASVRVRRLYAGYGATLLRDVPELMIQFAAYEHLCGGARRSNPAGQRRGSAWSAGLVGALAGTIAAVTTTPLDVIKTSLQCGGQASFRGAIQHVLRSRGSAGLFAGMAPRVLQTSLQSSVFFLCYEASGAAARHEQPVVDEPGLHVSVQCLLGQVQPLQILPRLP